MSRTERNWYYGEFKAKVAFEALKEEKTITGKCWELFILPMKEKIKSL